MEHKNQKTGILILRNLQSSGGDEHVALVKLASKKVIDDFHGLKNIVISYEESAFNMSIRMDDLTHGFGSGYTNTSFTFRPDILIRHIVEKEGYLRREQWKNIFDSSNIIIEAETDPPNIFSNVLKMEAYRKIRRDENIGRMAYAFILACWDDAKLPRDAEPFDEVWKFPKITGV